MTEVHPRSFASYYMELCKEQHLRPLSVISVTLPHSLDLTTDRVKMDDWSPILNALCLDQSLNSIRVRSKSRYRRPLEECNAESKSRQGSASSKKLEKRNSTNFTRSLLEWMSHSVAQCLRNSCNLTSLELEGIPFPVDCLAVLCVGLAGTQSLRHLSFNRCRIGDSGCELIARIISTARSIRSLNLGQCDLTSRCAPVLAGALGRQKLILFQDTWSQSLRYREPDLDKMPGLRRLTLNDNPMLGDETVDRLLDAVADSLWLKALDLQHCGITNRVLDKITQFLDCNDTLTVLDLRLNPELNDEVVREVRERLAKKLPAKTKSEYRWLSLSRKDSDSTVRTAKTSKEVVPKIASRPKTAIEQSKKTETRKNLQPKITKSATERPASSRQYRPKHSAKVVEPRSKMTLHVDLQVELQRNVGGSIKSMSTQAISESIQGHTSRSMETVPVGDFINSRILDEALETPIKNGVTITEITSSRICDERCEQEENEILLKSDSMNEIPVKDESSNRRDLREDREDAIARNYKLSIREYVRANLNDHRPIENESLNRAIEQTAAIEMKSRAINGLDMTSVLRILQKYENAEKEHRRLDAETKRIDKLLSEERAKREDAERRMSRLEEALINKEHINDFASKLLRKLDDCAPRKHNDRDIRERMALLARKSKSENLKRTNGKVPSKRKHAKSVLDMRESTRNFAPIETNIGDAGRTIITEIPSTKHVKETSTPRERARAIFSRLVNDETRNFDSRHG